MVVVMAVVLSVIKMPSLDPPKASVPAPLIVGLNAPGAVESKAPVLRVRVPSVSRLPDAIGESKSAAIVRPEVVTRRIGGLLLHHVQRRGDIGDALFVVEERADELLPRLVAKLARLATEVTVA